MFVKVVSSLGLFILKMGGFLVEILFPNHNIIKTNLQKKTIRKKILTLTESVIWNETFQLT